MNRVPTLSWSAPPPSTRASRRSRAPQRSARPSGSGRRATWTPKPSAYSYQWLRNGKVIKKATTSSYKLTKKDRKKKITVRASARRPGFADVTSTSKKTKAVK